MTASGDNKTRVRKSAGPPPGDDADKTVVRPGVPFGSRSEADAVPEPDAVQEADAAQEPSPPEPVAAEPVWPEADAVATPAAEPQEPADTVETVTAEEPADPVSGPETQPLAAAAPGAADVQTPEVDSPPTEEAAAETERDAAPEDDPDPSPGTDAMDPPEAGDPVPPPPSIKVQEEYASLLAALSDRIQTHPGGHDLLAVLRMLEGQTAPGVWKPASTDKDKGSATPPRIGKSRRRSEDIVRFGQEPSNEFPTSTIERAIRDNDNGLVLLVRFLGLLGPQGALPTTVTDEAIGRAMRRDDSFPRFLDLFNNRFIQLFYRAWADARPIVQHDRPDDDRFLSYQGSAIGLGSPIFRDLDRIDDRIKMLYAGLVSPKSKSAARLKALISGVFDVRVDIDQCVGTWLHLDPDDQLSIGRQRPGGAGSLGRDTIVGGRIYSVSDKIRIRIHTKDLDEYRKFLPPTRVKPNPYTEKLFDLIDFYLGLEIEYEIELALPKRCASAIRMDSRSSATLGHIGWLKPRDTAEASAPEADMEEEEMLTDTRFRPVRRHTAIYQ